MRVFVTGASGWVGSGLVPQLIEAGHEVVGLARSDASAAALARDAAEVHRGSLEDLDSLRDGAERSDGVIHLAFVHDFSDMEATSQLDRAAIDAMGRALAGSDRPLVIASGVATTAQGRPATEDDPANPAFPRSAAATLTIELADKGVRSSVVRLPPTTHGDGDAGFIAMLVQTARERGLSGHVGDGANVWPAVHRNDAARVFRLALEQGRAGSVWHAIAEPGVPTRRIAEAIGRQLDVPVVAIDPASSIDHFGWLGLIWSLDLPATSAITRRELGWQPTGPTLLDDIDAGHYTASGA
jgi:nucleoside-diphosphate-sugar epimerase